MIETSSYVPVWLMLGLNTYDLRIRMMTSVSARAFVSKVCIAAIALSTTLSAPFSESSLTTSSIAAAKACWLCRSNVIASAVAMWTSEFPHIALVLASMLNNGAKRLDHFYGLKTAQNRWHSWAIVLPRPYLPRSFVNLTAMTTSNGQKKLSADTKIWTNSQGTHRSSVIASLIRQ